MATINNVLLKAQYMVGLVGRNTGKAVSISKLKLQIIQQNTLIQSTYERIGTLVYEQAKMGTDNGEILAICMKEIDDILVQINDINTKIVQLKEGVVCSVCTTTNIADTVYCQNCGHKLIVRAEPKE